jgi:ubiquinone/menaquinone biosynthesis C-methylase UbiE
MVGKKEVDMELKTTQDISRMLRGYVPAAALGAAMELGLFWLLADQAKHADEVAKILGIPKLRCQYWLEYLSEMGLLDNDSSGYTPSATARLAILEARSQETWAFLAGEARERLPAVQDLAFRIREQGSVWDALGIMPPDYLANLKNDPENARRFTRMLFELHLGEAEQLSELLDLSGVKRLMDIGGGSGVMSLALLRRHPDLTAVVVDQANVCAAGQEIAKENGMEKRISFQVANFLQDEILSGFDMVMECDVGVYSKTFFRKIHRALNPGGRFVILDYQFETEGASRLNLMTRAFFNSLENPEFTFETANELSDMLLESGFQKVLEPRPLMDGLVIEAFK